MGPVIILEGQIFILLGQGKGEIGNMAYEGTDDPQPRQRVMEQPSDTTRAMALRSLHVQRGSCHDWSLRDQVTQNCNVAISGPENPINPAKNGPERFDLPRKAGSLFFEIAALGISDCALRLSDVFHAHEQEGTRELIAGLHRTQIATYGVVLGYNRSCQRCVESTALVRLIAT
jgi:hypothetical protein